jgi:L-lactate dehydrogenase complex protein LldF
VCPVKINIPEILIDLRARVTDQERKSAKKFSDPMYWGLRAANVIFARAWLFHFAQWAGRIGAKLVTRRDGWIHSLPSVGGKWTQTRDLRGLPKQTFHEWWKDREQGSKGAREQGARGAEAQ